MWFKHFLYFLFCFESSIIWLWCHVSAWLSWSWWLNMIVSIDSGTGVHWDLGTHLAHVFYWRQHLKALNANFGLFSVLKHVTYFCITKWFSLPVFSSFVHLEAVMFASKSIAFWHWADFHLKNVSSKASRVFAQFSFDFYIELCRFTFFIFVKYNRGSHCN